MSEFEKVSENSGSLNLMGDNNKNCIQAIIDKYYNEKACTFSDLIKGSAFIFYEKLKGMPTKNHYDYRSNIIPLVGRYEEIKMLNEFIDKDDRYKILSITANGHGGVGKSKLVYEFIKNSIEKNEISKEWDMFFVECSDFLKNLIDKVNEYDEIDKNILIVFDYVQAYEDEIRNFLYQTLREQGNIKKKIRVILIERSSAFEKKTTDNLSSNQEMNWYTKIIKKREDGVQSLEDYFWKDIKLGKLNDEQYVEIVKKYIEKIDASKLKIYDEAKIKNDIINRFKEIDPNIERVLYLLFTTEIAIYEGVSDISKTELLQKILEKEERRINSILGKNRKKFF